MTKQTKKPNPAARSAGRLKARAKVMVMCQCGCKRKFHPLYLDTLRQQKFATKDCRMAYHRDLRRKLVEIGKKVLKGKRAA